MVVMDMADGCLINVAHVIAAKMLRDEHKILVWMTTTMNPLEMEYDSEELMLEAYEKLRSEALNTYSK